jgi:hypothetical protein
LASSRSGQARAGLKCSDPRTHRLFSPPMVAVARVLSLLSGACPKTGYYCAQIDGYQCDDGPDAYNGFGQRNRKVVGRDSHAIRSQRTLNTLILRLPSTVCKSYAQSIRCSLRGLSSHAPSMTPPRQPAPSSASNPLNVSISFGA